MGVGGSIRAAAAVHLAREVGCQSSVPSEELPLQPLRVVSAQQSSDRVGTRPIGADAWSEMQCRPSSPRNRELRCLCWCSRNLS